jgi:hypothetical protein
LFRRAGHGPSFHACSSFAHGYALVRSS